MDAAGHSDPEVYLDWVARDAEAWDALVDRVVVLETWFFRDGAPFALAAERALAHFRRPSQRAFRVLSCPCSTGEEPYSLAMAFLEAGLPPGAFIIDALDVSPAAVAAA